MSQSQVSSTSRSILSQGYVPHVNSPKYPQGNQVAYTDAQEPEDGYESQSSNSVAPTQAVQTSREEDEVASEPVYNPCRPRYGTPRPQEVVNEPVYNPCCPYHAPPRPQENAHNVSKQCFPPSPPRHPRPNVVHSSPMRQSPTEGSDSGDFSEFTCARCGRPMGSKKDEDRNGPAEVVCYPCENEQLDRQANGDGSGSKRQRKSPPPSEFVSSNSKTQVISQLPKQTTTTRQSTPIVLIKKNESRPIPRLDTPSPFVSAVVSAHQYGGCVTRALRSARQEDDMKDLINLFVSSFFCNIESAMKYADIARSFVRIGTSEMIRNAAQCVQIAEIAKEGTRATVEELLTKSMFRPHVCSLMPVDLEFIQRIPRRVATHATHTWLCTVPCGNCPIDAPFFNMVCSVCFNPDVTIGCYNCEVYWCRGCEAAMSSGLENIEEARAAAVSEMALCTRAIHNDQEARNQVNVCIGVLENLKSRELDLERILRVTSAQYKGEMPRKACAYPRPFGLQLSLEQEEKFPNLSKMFGYQHQHHVRDEVSRLASVVCPQEAMVIDLEIDVDLNAIRASFNALNNGSTFIWKCSDESITQSDAFKFTKGGFGAVADSLEIAGEHNGRMCCYRRSRATNLGGGWRTFVMTFESVFEITDEGELDIKYSMFFNKSVTLNNSFDVYSNSMTLAGLKLFAPLLKQ